MQDLPHNYTVVAQGNASGSLTAKCENLADIPVAPPSLFGGPGDKWSPEDLFMASIANCFVLSFRAIARVGKLQWHTIECSSQGELDKVDGTIQFTKVISKIKLVIPATENKDNAERLLIKSDEKCLIRNSISCSTSIECEIVYSDE
ncbi:OsmC family protein [Aliiglaciecola sp. 3_MG-2023]|uniref:OsmC family protein n=1 Tax=Aliiglaciecola sp. 3_MG-2023 TaxID=3062644 RepID=UPI0026E158E7|nr:OsmC family protein [Aliiglaciecola sp. 3_MG-2023]MDO6694835.1 OsmC family protein [Aliiglaciecola sp. 3_MG-2023]